MWNYTCIRWLINWSDSTKIHGATVRFMYKIVLLTVFLWGCCRLLRAVVKGVLSLCNCHFLRGWMASHNWFISSCLAAVFLWFQILHFLWPLVNFTFLASLPLGKNIDTHCCVGSRVSMDVYGKKRNFSPLPGFETRIVQHVVSSLYRLS